MMRLLLTPAVLLLLTLAPAVNGESLFDDDEVAAFNEKQAQNEEPAGESLFDDDEIAAFQDKQAEQDDGPIEGGISFNSKENALTADIVFDERGNVAQGGSSSPDIAFYHVAELNGQRFDEPTQGSDMLSELIQKGEDYEVMLAPPSFNQFQCTEKVQSIQQVFEEYSHELSEEFLGSAAATLANEGITNTKQLGEVDAKDFDEIRGLPALIKSRLRKIAAEARKQSEIAGGKVDMDGKEVEEELRAFMNARDGTKGTDGQVDATTEAVPAAGSEQPLGDMEEEDGTFKSLVWAVLNCPTCKGKETIACFRTCRHGEGGVKRPWGECLNECIENRWLRATFWAMLPSEKS